MSRTFRKYLSVALCLIMVCGIVPLAVFNSSADGANYTTVEFGSFPQTRISATTGLTEGVDYVVKNGKYYAIEPIVWRVLDVETGLCVSEKCLYAMDYDDDTTDYASSDIRAWLYGADGNGTFYNTAFNESEKSQILTKEIISGVNDKAFLLSSQEVENSKYFSDSASRKAGYTDYTFTDKTVVTQNNATKWWTRSAEEFLEDRVTDVSYDGEVSTCYCYNPDCVRPAIYLDLDSGLFKAEITLDANNGTGETVKKTVTRFADNYPECTFTNGTAYFNGWYKDPECENLWDKNEVVTGDITLYAGWSEYKAGDIIRFGSYPQSEITDITGLTENEDYVTVGEKYYAYEPVEWIVLNESTGLCVSKYAIDSGRFDDDSNSYTDSEIRGFLCGSGSDSLYTKAFSAEEKTLLLQKKFNTYNYGSTTDISSTLEDKVFLLSTEEAGDAAIFADDDARKTTATDYALASGAICDKNNFCLWMLRSPGNYSNYVAYVTNNGENEKFGDKVTYEKFAVRPAIYLNLTSDFLRAEVTLVANNDTDETVTQTINKNINYYPECPFADKGYSFVGWYTDENCKNKWTDTDLVTTDITLYAKWKVNTPKIRINETTKEWEVSYDNGVTYESLGVKATGADDVRIESVLLTSTSNYVDTYTVTLTNGTTYTFTVSNGKIDFNTTDNDNSSDEATVTGSYYNAKGELILVMSDGSEINSGNPVKATFKLFIQRIVDFFKSLFETVKIRF